MRWLALVPLILTVSVCVTGLSCKSATDPARLDLTLRPVRFQNLPPSVQEVNAGSDQRLWYTIDLPVAIDAEGRAVAADLGAIKACIEHEFNRPTPQLLGAMPVYFETPAKGQRPRVWFISFRPYRLLGYDGKAWQEYDPNLGTTPKDIRDFRYYRGHLGERGNRERFCQHVQIGDYILFAASDGVTSFNTRSGQWSHQVLANPEPRFLIEELDLAVTPDGQRVLALVPMRKPAALWQFAAGRWEKLPDLWRSNPRPRHLFLSSTGVWAEHELGTVAFYPLEGKPQEPVKLQKPIERIDRAFPIDRQRMLVTTVEGRGLNQKWRAFIISADGAVAEIDARELQSAMPSATFSSASTPTHNPDQFWFYSTERSHAPILFDISSGKVIDSGTSPNFPWLQAIAPDGVVYFSPNIPGSMPSQRPVMAYQPAQPDDRDTLPVSHVEITSGHFCVASDGAIWAELEKGGVSRFDGKTWTPVPGLVPSDVTALLPGAQGQVLAEFKSDGAMLISPQKPSIYAKSTKELIGANREAITAAFPANNPAVIPHGYSLFADPAGNIWFRHYGWRVLAKAGWIEGKVQADSLGDKPFNAYVMLPIGNGERALVAGGNNSPTRTAFLASVENGAIRFEELARPLLSQYDPPPTDRDGGCFLSGGKIRHLNDKAKIIEWADLLANAVPLHLDLDGNLWFDSANGAQGRAAKPSLAIARNGKLAQTLDIPALTREPRIFSARPGSVWLCSQIGVFHFVMRDGAIALDHTYALDGVINDLRSVQYSPLGYLVTVGRSPENGFTPKHMRLYLVKLPN